MLGNSTFKLKIAYQNERTFLILSLKKKEQINENLLQTLKKDNDYGLLSATWTKSGNINKLTFDISNLVCIYEYTKTPIQQEKYFGLISQIQCIYEKCCKSMMPVNNLICSLKYTFYDPVNEKIYMAYVPVMNGNYSSNIVRFLFDFDENCSIITSDANTLNSYKEFLKKHLAMQNKNKSKNKNSVFSYNDLYNFLHEKDIHKQNNVTPENNIATTPPIKEYTQTPARVKPTQKNYDHKTYTGTIPLFVPESETETAAITDNTISSPTIRIPKKQTHISLTDNRGNTYFVNSFPFKIGRNPSNDIVIDNPCISGFHAEIICENNNYFLKDNRSANGTYINNKEIFYEKITDGTTFILHDHPLTFNILSPEKSNDAFDITQTSFVKPQKEFTDYVAYIKEENSGNLIYINSFPFSHPSLEGISITKVYKDICIKNNTCNSLSLETESIQPGTAYSLYSGCSISINNRKYIFYIKN